jgi:hypothetical protein
MRVIGRFRPAVLPAALLLAGVNGAFAVCTEFGGYAIFQCADKAYFSPPPFTVTLDPNNRPTNVTGVFWQIGFGNNLLNNGAGSAGTGNSGTTAATFNGNDAGTTRVDVVAARAITGDTRIPNGSLCLGNNNWGNSGVDGCCDNPRDTGALMPGGLTNDDVLNPFYNVYYARNGMPGIYSRVWIQDYPTAALLKDPTGRYFAFAVVATMDRANDGSGANGPCGSPPGSNPAPCDFRSGFYEFKRVLNGTTNATDPTKNNVVPWQEVPKPKLACTSNCLGGGNRTVNASWTGLTLYHDNTSLPSDNPKLAPADPTRAPGAGVADIRGVFPLLRYQVEMAPVSGANLDPNGNLVPATLIWSNIGPEVSTPAATGLVIPPDSCLRVKVLFGKKQETNTTTPANCRVGKCGDVGYQTTRGDLLGITCVGGALLTESFTGVSADRSRGGIVVRFSVGAELTVTGYNIYAVGARGAERLATATPVSCVECDNGVSASYEVALPSSAARGAKAVVVEALASPPFRSAVTPVR